MALTISGFLTTLVMTATAFAPNYATFAVLRFFSGVFSIANFLTVFVWGKSTMIGPVNRKK